MRNDKLLGTIEMPSSAEAFRGVHILNYILYHCKNTGKDSFKGTLNNILVNALGNAFSEKTLRKTMEVLVSSKILIKKITANAAFTKKYTYLINIKKIESTIGKIYFACDAKVIGVFENRSITSDFIDDTPIPPQELQEPVSEEEYREAMKDVWGKELDLNPADWIFSEDDYPSSPPPEPLHPPEGIDDIPFFFDSASNNTTHDLPDDDSNDTPKVNSNSITEPTSKVDTSIPKFIPKAKRKPRSKKKKMYHNCYVSYKYNALSSEKVATELNVNRDQINNDLYEKSINLINRGLENLAKFHPERYNITVEKIRQVKTAINTGGYILKDFIAFTKEYYNRLTNEVKHPASHITISFLKHIGFVSACAYSDLTK